MGRPLRPRACRWPAGAGGSPCAVCAAARLVISSRSDGACGGWRVGGAGGAPAAARERQPAEVAVPPPTEKRGEARASGALPARTFGRKPRLSSCAAPAEPADHGCVSTSSAVRREAGSTCRRPLRSERAASDGHIPTGKLMRPCLVRAMSCACDGEPGELGGPGPSHEPSGVQHEARRATSPHLGEPPAPAAAAPSSSGSEASERRELCDFRARGMPTTPSATHSL